MVHTTHRRDNTVEYSISCACLVLFFSFVIVMKITFEELNGGQEREAFSCTACQNEQLEKRTRKKANVGST